jgi:hypothetical protein
VGGQYLAGDPISTLYRKENWNYIIYSPHHVLGDVGYAIRKAERGKFIWSALVWFQHFGPELSVVLIIYLYCQVAVRWKLNGISYQGAWCSGEKQFCKFRNIIYEYLVLNQGLFGLYRSALTTTLPRAPRIIPLLSFYCDKFWHFSRMKTFEEYSSSFNPFLEL